MKAKLVKENIGDILKGKELSGYLKEINDVKKLFKSISNDVYDNFDNGMFSIHVSNSDEHKRKFTIILMYVTEEYNRIHIKEKPLGWTVFFDKEKVYNGLELNEKIIQDSINYLYPYDLSKTIENLSQEINDLQQEIDMYKKIEELKNES